MYLLSFTLLEMFKRMRRVASSSIWLWTVLHERDTKQRAPYSRTGDPDHLDTDARPSHSGTVRRRLENLGIQHIFRDTVWVYRYPNFEILSQKAMGCRGCKWSGRAMAVCQPYHLAVQNWSSNVFQAHARS